VNLQRRRGKTDLPLGGSIDTLNTVYTRIDEGRLVGTAGDFYILEMPFVNIWRVNTTRVSHQRVSQKAWLKLDCIKFWG